MTRLMRVEQVPKEVTYSYRCDHCGKVAEGNELIPCHSGDKDYGGTWHHFSSGHSEWGNDSVDSFEEYDACSFPCYVEIVRKVLAQWRGYTTLRIDDRSGEFIAELVAAIPESAKT
jgi:hypothetical protein